MAKASLFNSEGLLPGAVALDPQEVESINITGKGKVKKFTREGDFKITRTPCPAWSYLGLGKNLPIEEGFNIDIQYDPEKKPEHFYYGSSVSLKKINHCCGIVEMCLIDSISEYNAQRKDSSIAVVNKALEYAKSWGKGLIILSSTSEEQRKFFKKHFGFKEVARFTNPNNGNVNTHHIKILDGCETKAKE